MGAAKEDRFVGKPFIFHEAKRKKFSKSREKRTRIGRIMGLFGCTPEVAIGLIRKGKALRKKAGSLGPIPNNLKVWKSEFNPK